MSLRHVIRIEGHRLVSAPGVWLATVGFVTAVALGVTIPYLSLSDPSASVGAAFLLGPGTDILLPFLIVIFSYSAIAGHRNRGSIHVFLQMPIDRRRMYFGITLARVVVISTIAFFGLVVGSIVCLLLYGIPPVTPVLAFVAMTIVATICFTAIGVGVSGIFARPIHALSVLIGGFVVAHVLWELLVSGGVAIIHGSDAATSRTAEFLTLLSPLEAYRTAGHGLLPPSPHLDFDLEGSEASATPGSLVGGEIAASELALILIILGVWAVVLLLIGYRQFRNAEIA